MDVDDSMFKFIPEEEREAAKAAYLRMAAGGGGEQSAKADDDDDEDGVEVFAEEDIEDDLYLTDEADGLTQATVQQAKGAIVKSVRFTRVREGQGLSAAQAPRGCRHRPVQRRQVVAREHAHQP